jgi:hypothetical protein
VKTSPKRSCAVIENERFGLDFAKTGSIISGTDTAAQDFSMRTSTGEIKKAWNRNYGFRNCIGILSYDLRNRRGNELSVITAEASDTAGK